MPEITFIVDELHGAVLVEDNRNLSADAVEIFKNRFTPERLKKAGLNERQIKAVLYAAENGSINNSQYQDLFGDLAS